MRKTILGIIGIALIALSIMVAMNLVKSNKRGRPQPQKVVKTVFTDTVVNKTTPIVINANGNLTAVRRLELFAEVQGVFRPGSVLFRPGQAYRSGQTIIRIDDSEYYASVQSAKSNLYNALASIMPDLRLDFPEVYPKWQAYLTNFDLNKSTPKLPEMTSEKENYFLTGRGIVSNYYSVKNLEQRLAKYRIAAPFDGVLTEALVTEGTLIRNGQKLGSFIDPSLYELEVALSKSFSGLLQPGQNVALSNLEKTMKFAGTVSRVNASIDQTTQTISAYVKVKDERLKEGMYLEAQLNAREVPVSIQIDRNLVSDRNEIFIVRDSILDVIAVKPVYFGDKMAVITDVPEGSVILSKPLPGAYPGMLVKVYQESKENNGN
ncbi:MAG: HlyD family efflux transporter periplasmic adaptor subunit [Flavobacteriaceae bacterium]|nr:HlyD family efflux transporter periplasmic adaptor subunit [Bacteroidia bacterium]MBT8287249.1 HlyD family efflux transporter periplasmic adaptor subunit [Bacteroidia bacterium]NNF75607.1 HlyD family efflux transporter periplasmic adaptor subunit [Flavobacteriaceae bacterium]NNK74392.1 HlyD family efflux transporter periplasmic adaptor subunit [Flavobacteriaceae bacterium]